MEFQEVVRRRRMVRNYDPSRPIPDSVVDRLLANALRAPSAGFSQGWAFLVLSTPAERERFWAATADPSEPDPWLRDMQNAPLLIVPLSHKQAYLDRYAEPDKAWTDRDEARWPVPYWDIDTGFATLLMLLTAVDEELGACFFGVPPSAHGIVPGGLRRAGGVHPDRLRGGGLSGAGPAVAVAPARAPAGRGRRASRLLVSRGR